MNALDYNLKDLMRCCLEQPNKFSSAYSWYYQYTDGKWEALYLTGGTMSNYPLFIWVPDDIINPFEKFNYIIDQI